MKAIKGDSQNQKPLPSAELSVELPALHTTYLQRLRLQLEVAEKMSAHAVELQQEIIRLNAEANKIKLEVSIGSDTIVKMALEDAELSGRKYQLMPNLKDVLVY